MMQIQSLTLSNDDDQFNLVRWSNVGEVTRITNPITIDHTLLRQYLLLIITIAFIKSTS